MASDRSTVVSMKYCRLHALKDGGSSLSVGHFAEAFSAVLQNLGNGASLYCISIFPDGDHPVYLA